MISKAIYNQRLARGIGFLTITLFAMASFGTFSGCEDLSKGTKRIIVENDPTSLAGRVQYTNEIIEVDTTGTGGRMAKTRGGNADTVILTLVAEVLPPTYNGITLQATDVKIKDKKAYVSYNVRGETFLGAVDIFDVEDINQPTLVSSALFTDTDINGLTEKGGYLYLASATERTQFSSPAILERIELDHGLLTTNSETIDIPSYAATDVDVAKHWIYVTSGALGGYVTILDEDTFTKYDSVAVEDARGVDADKEDVGVVAGTPARLLTFDRDLGTLKNEWILSGATIEFSKSTVEIKKKKAILALGDGGTQIVCLATGAVIDSIPQPSVPDLDSSVTVTNTASVDKRLLFMANGEAGVYVGIADEKFDKKDCEVDNLRVLGKFRFADLQSVNHVQYKDDVMFIASGLGGLKIVTVQVN